MHKKTISYSELAKRVGDMVLFNNHSNTDEDWYSGLIEQPLLSEEIETIHEERLTEDKELEESEPYTLLDYCEGSIYQTYAITQRGAEYLLNHTSEVVSYSDIHDLFLWHVMHFGTPWDGVSVEVTEWDFDEEHEYMYSFEDIMKYKADY